MIAFLVPPPSLVHQVLCYSIQADVGGIETDSMAEWHARFKKWWNLDV